MITTSPGVCCPPPTSSPQTSSSAEASLPISGSMKRAGSGEGVEGGGEGAGIVRSVGAGLRIDKNGILSLPPRQGESKRRPVSRCLFGPPDPKSGEWAKQQLEELKKEEMKKWEFDFTSGKPFENPVRYKWKPVGPKYPHLNKSLSSSPSSIIRNSPAPKLTAFMPARKRRGDNPPHTHLRLKSTSTLGNISTS